MKSRSTVYIGVFIALTAVFMSGCASSQLQPQNENMPPIVVAGGIYQGPVFEKGDEYMIDAPAETAPIQAVDATYTVKKGDSLSAISQKTGVTIEVISALNGLTNPNRISVGQVLVLSGDVSPVKTSVRKTRVQLTRVLTGDSYTVQAGDSLSGIAAAFKTTTAAVKSANNLTSDTIRIGAKLKIPAGAESISAEPVSQSTTVVSNDLQDVSAEDVNAVINPAVPGI